MQRRQRERLAARSGEADRNQGAQQPALYSLVIAGVMISIIPLIGLFLALQRYWRIDLISGSLKG